MSNTRISEKDRDLREWFQKKPVTLDWFLAKSTSLIEQGFYKEAEDLIKDKVVLHYLYDGVLEHQVLYEEFHNKANDTAMKQYRCFIRADLEKNRNVIEQIMSKVDENERSFFTNESSSIGALAEGYISCGKWLNHYIVKQRMLLLMQNTQNRKWIGNQMNYGYIKESIAHYKKAVICIDREDANNEAYILGKCLSEMGCPAYVISQPEQIEVDTPIPLAETVGVSDENATQMYGFIHLPSIELIYQGKSLGNNCADLINAICEPEETVLVLASSTKFEELSRSPVLHNRIDNLCGYQEGFRTAHYAFGWCGSYLDYISQLYGMDVKEALYRQPECRFSIVIPVRNSAVTLQHTLKTCLNQRFQGDYEIVISDNSTEGNTEVYQYVQTLSDPRIRYYKTPRDLRLSRSFEYAFLQARGEYVLSIGADDAVLPWALEAWNDVIEQYPQEEVFAWERGFYAWPGFNGGQQHQFNIPGKYEKGRYDAAYVEPVQFLSMAMDTPSNMYLLPMLYINSGFKRSFMQTIYAETGRLWDGICQDIYMGVIVSVIKDKIVRMRYPLTIAGMSSASVGAMANLPEVDQNKAAAATARVLQENNVGGFSRSEVECLMPELGSDVSSLYNCILRAVNRGLIPARYLIQVFNWKKWFMKCYRIMSKKDIYFDRKIHQMRFAAMKHGEEFLKWFDENIYQDALTPVIFPETDGTKKTYREIDDGHRVVLDASRYGVENSYDASLLFEKLTGL